VQHRKKQIPKKYRQ